MCHTRNVTSRFRRISRAAFRKRQTRTAARTAVDRDRMRDRRGTDRVRSGARNRKANG